MNVLWNIGITFSSSGMEKVKICAPATFCFGKNRTILTMKIEYHRLMCNHFWKTLITSNNDIDYMSNLRLFFFIIFKFDSFDSKFKIMRSPSAPSGWQNLAAFRRGQNGHGNCRQARIYNFRDKCVVFARNRKFANLTQ